MVSKIISSTIILFILLLNILYRVHYVVFDLWTGIYIVQDSINIKMVTNVFNQLILIPILFFTMMLGPTGLLLYSIIKSIFQSLFPKKNKTN